MKAVIVGAGIGGLAAGLALTRAGFEVELLEQAPEITEIGAGLQISPNGVKALKALGGMDAVDPHVFEPDSIDMVMGQSGRKIFELPMKGYATQRWGDRFLQIHRADLQMALKTALGTTAGLVIRTDAKATGYVRERGGASVYLENGDRVFGNLVIGADGLHSVIRQQITGPDRARFTGNVAWRCTVPEEVLRGKSPPAKGRIWAGAGKHAVTTRIEGGAVINFVGIVEQDDWQEESWSTEGRREDALKAFAGWAPQIISTLEAAGDLKRWALFDRPPLATWSDGPVTLLGDAAHPMLPSMAQGAVQALEDAVILADCLKTDDDKLVALQRYFDLRIDRVSQVQRRSADNLRLFHKSGLARQAIAYMPIWLASRISPNLIQARQDWIYGYDPTTAAD